MRLLRIRLPRIRYTIGRLMAVILVAGLVSWVVFFAVPRLREHSIAVKVTEARLKQARLVREVTEYALKEYTEGIYKQDKATYEGQIALAKSDQERTKDRLAWSRTMVEPGVLQYRSREAEQIAKQQADFDLEQARTQLEVLEKYTGPKQIKSLRADIDKARADEQVKQAAYQAELDRNWWRLLGF